MEFLPEEIQAYSEKMSSPEPAHLSELDRETHLKILYPRMLSGHLQGRLLSMVSKMVQPKLAVEVGTYTGYSAICMAEGLAPGGKLITIEVDPELEETINRYFEKAGVADRVELVIADATAYLDSIEGPVDLAFLDADKQNYVRYYETLVPKMRSGGVIMADNVLWSGRVLDPDVHDKETEGLRNFANFVAEDERVEQVLLTVRDGIMIIRKK